MADIYNVIRGDGVFFEGMTKEQIISAIAEATGNTVEDIDSAFITKLKEINKGNAIRLWMGTNAEYNAIETKEDDVLYIVTDDTFVNDVNSTLENLSVRVDAIQAQLETNFNQMLEQVDSQYNELSEELLNMATMSQTFGLEYSGNNTRNVSLSNDLEIGKVYNLYITLNFYVEYERTGATSLWNSGVNVNAKTSGTYNILEREILSDNNVGIDLINSIASGTTSQKLFGLNNEDHVFEEPIYDDENLPTHSMVVRLKVVRTA